MEHKHIKKISIVGLGYIGLPTALVAASREYVVQGYDIDAKKIDLLNKGIAPIVEPGIQELLTRVRTQNIFSATTTLEEADCFVIAVPTPFTKSGDAKRADLSYVFHAGLAVAKKLKPGNTIILESTVPVGTTKKLAAIITASKMEANSIIQSVIRLT